MLGFQNDGRVSAPLKVPSAKGNLDVDVKQSVEIVHQEAEKEIEADAPKEGMLLAKEPSANSAVKDDALGNKRLRKQVRKSDQKNAPEFEKAR